MAACSGPETWQRPRLVGVWGGGEGGMRVDFFRLRVWVRTKGRFRECVCGGRGKRAGCRVQGTVGRLLRHSSPPPLPTLPLVSFANTGCTSRQCVIAATEDGAGGAPAAPPSAADAGRDPPAPDSAVGGGGREEDTASGCSAGPSTCEISASSPSVYATMLTGLLCSRPQRPTRPSPTLTLRGAEGRVSLL